MKRSPFVFLFFILIIWSINSSARQNINLKDVFKIALSITPGGMSDGKSNKKYEVSYEDGKWKSQQILDSSKKVVVSDIDPQIIIRLLKYLSTKDTSIHLEQFALEDLEMALALDSLNEGEYLKYVELTASQKAVMLHALSDKRLQNSLIRKSLIPEMLDDRTEYKITVTTTNGIIRSIQALSFANIYNLPWNVNGRDIFDPGISRIFATLIGNKKFDKQYKRSLYEWVILHVFYNKFRTPFCLEKLKRAHPVAYSALTTTMHPEAATRKKHGWYLRLKSSRLSSQISIVGRFKRPDSILVAMKQMEDRLSELDRYDHYFFKNLRINTDQSASITVTDLYFDDDLNLEIYNRIKDLYKPINNIPLHQINIIDITKANIQGHQEEYARWMLLPDDSIIFIAYDKEIYRNSSIAYVYDKNGNLLQKLTGLNNKL